MFKIYLYCYYLFVNVWKNTWFRDAKLGLGLDVEDNTPSILSSSMCLISIVQISNINTLLIIPTSLIRKQISANILVIIVLLVGIYNLFFINHSRQYKKADSLWKDESPHRKKIKNSIVAVFFVASMVMLFVSAKIVYIPHSLTIPYWGD